jgi:hypothetical protein
MYVLAVGGKSSSSSNNSSSSSSSSSSSLPSIDNKKSKDIVDKRSTYYYHPLLYSPMLERMMSTSPNNSSATNDQISYSSFTESKSDSWNLQGNIYFQGMNCNPKKTNITVPPCSGPYPNYEVIVSSSKDCKTILSKTKSDRNGNYRMRLDPGNYIICPKSGNATPPPPHPFGVKEEPKPIHFIIKEGTVTNLDLVIRTGIR